MPSTLYLDAARMGRMAPTAQWALQDFVRLAGEEGCTLYFERFVKEGFAALPEALRELLPGLRSWGGLAELKQALGRYLGLSPLAPVLLAGRSTSLAEFAAQALFGAERRVLLTDLTWPAYRRIFLRAARRRQVDVEFVKVRSSILAGTTTASQFVARVGRLFKARDCGGLFLPEISHDGIRLPIKQVTEVVRSERPSARIVIDGSQALGQFPVCLAELWCDFYLAGCHKWLGSHLPLGIGTFPNPASAPHVFSAAVHRSERGSLDDPLLAFLLRLEARRGRRFTETVNLAPLFACRGALRDAENTGPSHLRHRLANAQLVRRIAPMTGWTPVDPPDEFRSAAVLLRTAAVSAPDPARLRELFHQRGVALTGYDRGHVRLSMPPTPFSREDVGQLIQALALVLASHRSGRLPEFQPALA